MNAVQQRGILGTTRGVTHGPITRLMSPSDLGRALKPFVFLDRFNLDMKRGLGMPIHPHSGIATVTVLTEGDMAFAGPAEGCGSLSYGGVEWMRAGRGVWHGDELARGEAEQVRGFQLWVALPEAQELGPVDRQYLAAPALPVAGPATVVLGSHGGVTSPVRSPEPTFA